MTWKVAQHLRPGDRVGSGRERWGIVISTIPVNNKRMMTVLWSRPHGPVLKTYDAELEMLWCVPEQEDL